MILVGVAARDSELRARVDELLRRASIEASYSERATFKPRELLGSRAAPADALSVFVVIDTASSAHLYFRAPEGDRFLVRTLALRSGLDELGREQVGQVVEASVDALLHSSVGLSREQLRTELEAETNQKTSPAKGPETQRSLAPYRPSTTNAQRRQAIVHFTGWLAARYSLELSSGSVPLEHGPGFELGAGTRGKLLLRARFGFEHVFPATVHAGPVDVKTGIERWRATLDFGVPLRAETTELVLALGAGQDVIRLEPRSSSDPSITPASTSRSAPAAMHAEARIETGSVVAFVAGATLDMLLTRTEYDLSQASGAQRVGALSLVHPGLLLALAWRPEIGRF